MRPMIVWEDNHWRVATAHNMIAGVDGLDKVDADVVKSLAERLDCFKV